MAEERGDGNAEEYPSEVEDSQEEDEEVRHLHSGKTPSPPSALANQEAEASTADEVVEQQHEQHLVEEVIKLAEVDSRHPPRFRGASTSL